MSCCIGPKGVSSNNDKKGLFLCELHFSLILTSGPLNHQWTNNQHITLLYNEMKSLSSIFRCCFGPKGVSSRKALFPCQIHFSPNITSRSLKNQRTNKQLITLLHNEMKRVPFSAAAMVSTLYFQRKNEKHYISDIITFHLVLQVDLQIISGHTSNLLTFSTMSWRTKLQFWAAALVPRCVF